MTHIDINAIKSLLTRYINETEGALKNREYAAENVPVIRNHLQNCKTALSLLNGDRDRSKRTMEQQAQPKMDIRNENK